MAGSGRFERQADDPYERAQRVGDEVRRARAEVYSAYLRTRRRGVALLEEPDEPDGDEPPEEPLRTT